MSADVAAEARVTIAARCGQARNAYGHGREAAFVGAFAFVIFLLLGFLITLAARRFGGEDLHSVLAKPLAVGAAAPFTTPAVGTARG